MTLSERWLASEQRRAMSYERWLEYVVQDAEAQLETARKAITDALSYLKNDDDSLDLGELFTELEVALAPIRAGRFDRKCSHCDFVTEYPLMFENHLKYGHGAGQKGGK